MASCPLMEEKFKLSLKWAFHSQKQHYGSLICFQFIHYTLLQTVTSSCKNALYKGITWIPWATGKTNYHAWLFGRKLLSHKPQAKQFRNARLTNQLNKCSMPSQFQLQRESHLPEPERIYYELYKCALLRPENPKPSLWPLGQKAQQ